MSNEPGLNDDVPEDSPDLDDMQLSEAQRRFLAYLPADRNELAEELDIAPTTVSYHRKELDKKGVRLVRDGHTGRWMLAGYQEFNISDSRLPDAPRLSSLQSIALGFLTVLSPQWFIWVLELLVNTRELTDTSLVFFIWSIPPLATYHALMYLLFIVNWSVGTWLIATAFFRQLE
jgi:biotin operon repressor